MKKTVIILCLLLALTLFTACGENANEQAKQPQLPDSTAQSDSPTSTETPAEPDAPTPSAPSADDETPNEDKQTAPTSSANWRENVPDSPYDIVTLVREMNFTGYVSNGMEKHDDTQSYTFYKNSVCDQLYYIASLTDENAQNISFTGSYTEIKAIFRNESDGKSCEKTFILTDFEKDGRMHLAVADIENKTVHLTENAVWYFLSVCDAVHLGEQNLILDHYITDTNIYMTDDPVLLKDVEQNLTPEEAANELIKKFFASYTYDQPDCPYIITEIGDTKVKLYDADAAKNYELLNDLDLRKNQWVVFANPTVKLEGPIQGDGSGIHWCMEYESGWWRLWMDEVFYNQNKSSETVSAKQSNY